MADSTRLVVLQRIKIVLIAASVGAKELHTQTNLGCRHFMKAPGAVGTRPMVHAHQRGVCHALRRDLVEWDSRQSLLRSVAAVEQRRRCVVAVVRVADQAGSGQNSLDDEVGCWGPVSRVACAAVLRRGMRRCAGSEQQDDERHELHHAQEHHGCFLRFIFSIPQQED